MNQAFYFHRIANPNIILFSMHELFYLIVQMLLSALLHFVAFFHVASLLSTGVDNEKVGVDNEKALELTNSTVFHRGRQ